MVSIVLSLWGPFMLLGCETMPEFYGNLAGWRLDSLDALLDL